jgi:hypothetical protein
VVEREECKEYFKNDLYGSLITRFFVDDRTGLPKSVRLCGAKLDQLRGRRKVIDFRPFAHSPELCAPVQQGADGDSRH